MRIAFDGTVLHGRMSGVGYYCEELLKAMLALDEAPELFVFSHRPISRSVSPGSQRIRFSESGFCPVRALYLHAVLPRILDKVKPDLCHYTNFLAPLRDDTPYVVTVHDMGLERLRGSHPLTKRLYTRPLVPYVARRARLVITNSEYSKWEIVRYLAIPEDRIRVTPLAASDEFHPISEHHREPVIRGYPLASPYLLFVGNLEPRKNLVRLLEAFAEMRDKDHLLAIAGNNWYRGGEVAAAVRRLRLGNRVRLLGYVPREHLPALYGGATAFVYPSLLEGFGMPVVEAMACGTPVITSDHSSLKEIAAGAALLVDTSDVRCLQQALTDVIEDVGLRTDLALRGLQRASQYSWRITAEQTLDAYREAVNGSRVTKAASVLDEGSVLDAIRRTLDYAALFQYPLRADELRERLPDVKIDIRDLERYCRKLHLSRVRGFIASDSEVVSLREFREAVSDSAIRSSWPHLETLANIPFVRMIAFSGATAHRNMTDGEDIDLFLVVEDGKVWAAYLIAMLWAKWKGLRGRLCMNYVISDRALPLFEYDSFTAQQVIALKPIFGRAVYDQFLRSNSFVQRQFPNFSPQAARSKYPEITRSRAKTILEKLFCFGPIQVLERVSRSLLGRYLRRKVAHHSTLGVVDVLLEPRRLKLHLNSHKQAVLAETRSPSQFVSR